MIGSRNGDAPGHDSSGPSASARFALSDERHAAEDAIRREWLNERCRAHPVERDEPETCFMAGCDKPVAYKGLCHAHYNAEWRKKHRKPAAAKPKSDKCKKGHTYDHVRIDAAGNVYRVCRECRRQRERRRWAQLKAA